MNRTKQQLGKVIIHPATIRLLIDATWEYAHRMLWNNHSFSHYETKKAKSFIREYYESIPRDRKAGLHHYFSGYCIRIQMAREYVLRRPHRYIPHPCLWLNKTNLKGFAGTKSWYDSMIQQQYYLNQRFRPKQYTKTA